MPSFAARRELAGLRGLAGRAGAALTGLEIFNQGKSGSILDRALRSIPSTANTDAGRRAGNVLGNEIRYMGNQLRQGSLPYLGNEMRYVTNTLSRGRVPYSQAPAASPRPQAPSAPPASRGGSTRQQAPFSTAPRAGSPSQQAPSPGAPRAGSSGQQAAADRAYQRELSRASQLTAQDVEFQRYEKARAAARTQKEMDEVRNMGLHMWQAKYNDTPMGQHGGAIGAFNPLMQKTFGYQTGMAPDQLAKQGTAVPVPPISPAPLSTIGTGESQYQSGDLGTRAMLETGYDPAAYGIGKPNVAVPVPPINIGTGESQYQSGDLGTRAMLETGYDPAAYGITPTMIEAMKKRLLEQSAK
jgi:hypothetical protein